LLTAFLTLNTGESPNVAVESTLSSILEANAPEKYYLSAKACEGILRRAERRGKKLPKMLKDALEQMIQREKGTEELETEDKAATLTTPGGGTASGPSVVFKADDGSFGDAAPTLVGDHNNRVTDHTGIVVEDLPVVAYGIDRAAYNGRTIVRRLTPTECARLQGFPDRWGDIKPFDPTEWEFWAEVRNTHAAINGKKVQEYTAKQMETWYNKLHTDSAEYKMWGNGIALPPAVYCMQGMVEAMDTHEDTEDWML